MENSRLTYVEALSNALSLLEANVGNGFDDFDVSATIEKLTALRDQTIKRNSADRKPTKKQAEAKAVNDKVADAIRTLLSNAESMTVAEMREAHDALALLTPQKVTAVVGAMIKSGEIVRTVEKRVARFSLVR